jgi:hypothetical protein
VPRIITENALLVCDHELGHVHNQPSQDLFTIDGRKVLVEIDPQGRQISGCPNIGFTVKPCTNTLQVAVGYSTFVRVDHHRICLDTVNGLTDGTPPGTVHYKVRTAGQDFVEERP